MMEASVKTRIHKLKVRVLNDIQFSSKKYAAQKGFKKTRHGLEDIPQSQMQYTSSAHYLALDRNFSCCGNVI